jgi:biotin synthase
MSTVDVSPLTESPLAAGNWTELAEQVLAGRRLTREEGLAILSADDGEVLGLLDAAWRIRRAHFGNEVQLYYLKNAQSGLCAEDCGYCSQNVKSAAEIDKYKLLDEDQILAGAKQAYESQARTYCIVTSGRGPTDKDIDHLTGVVRKIKDEYGLHICCCLGLMDEKHTQKLAEAGVDRVNHNLNTSRNYYENICTTHTFDDRLNTLRAVRESGMEVCCGIIAGMGEEYGDVVDLAFELAQMKVESIPVNFLNAIAGTQLEGLQVLNPRFCLKILCLFRMANPETEIRIAGGREINLRSMQAMGLYAANSLFVSDYLTTKGQKAEDDFGMIEDLGFKVVVGDHESRQLYEGRQRNDSAE